MYDATHPCPKEAAGKGNRLWALLDRSSAPNGTAMPASREYRRKR